MESKGIPRLVWFCDLGAGFGEGGDGLTYRFPWLFLDWFIHDTPFMLGIWHEADWLKERFGLSISMVEWYVEVSNLVGSCLCLIKAKFYFFCTCYYVALTVFISLLFKWFNVGYKHVYMTSYSHGYFMYLLVTKRIMDARPN